MPGGPDSHDICHECRWQEKYFEAKTALEGREEKLAAVGDLIERKLLLLGCTAIEDKLQAGVPEAIERLANAGIRIWVLTGDKQVPFCSICHKAYGRADQAERQRCCAGSRACEQVVTVIVLARVVDM